jgi:hypothetical protein
MAFRLVLAASKVVGIDPTEKLALIVLADYANDQGVAWPALPTIAQQSCICKRQAIRVIQQLEDRGLITVDPSRGRARSNRYMLNLDVLEKMTPMSPLEPEKVTPVSPFGGEKVTSTSPNSNFEKVTSTTRKGDAHVTEMVTPMSPDPISDPVRTKNKNSSTDDEPLENRPVEIPRRQLAKLTHVVLDDLGDGARITDISDLLKTRCVRLGWRLHPSVIAAAIESAQVQRQLRVSPSHARRGAPSDRSHNTHREHAATTLRHPVNRTGPAPAGKYDAITQGLPGRDS